MTINSKKALANGRSFDFPHTREVLVKATVHMCNMRSITMIDYDRLQGPKRPWKCQLLHI